MQVYRSDALKGLERARTILVFGSLLLIVGLGEPVVQAQEESLSVVDSSPSKIEPGMSREVLIGILGEPDRVGGTAGEFLYYGKSIVFISNDVVQGMSDRGELSHITEHKVEAPRVYPSYTNENGWLNPWTRLPNPTVEVLLEFLQS